MSDRDQNTIADRFEAYLLGQLDDSAMDQLEDELRHDSQQADACVDVMATLAMVREQFRDQREQTDELTKDPTLNEFHDLLSELSAMEAAADAQLVQWVGHVKTTKPIWQQWPIVIPTAMAALLAIAVILIVALPSNTTSTSPSFTNTPDEPGPVGPTLNNVVATLTATHNAVWDQKPHEHLRAGQRLTLTAGFAEITTEEGAVVILEAPATIELLDNDNALRLHAGKLVGICETDTSKGFLVRTPHMDITDLGTRFGVAIDESGQTLTKVFEGSVRVEPGQAIADGFGSQVLLSGKDITINAQGEQTDRDRFAADTFRSLQTVAQIPIAPREGIASITGDLQWISRATGEINDGTWPRSNQASIHQELAGHRLGADVAVSYHLPGVYTQHNADTPSSTIPSGAVIRSYFIGLKAKGPGMQSSRASITFDGEILGIIVTTDSGQSFFDATHNKPDPVIPMVGSSLESGHYDPEKVGNTDMIEIGQDRRTLTFALQGVTHIDYFRVIVRDHVDQEAGQN